MANSTADIASVEVLLARTASSLGGSAATSLAQEMDRLTGQLGRLQSVNEAALESVRTNTQVVKASTTTTSSAKDDGRSVAGTVLSVLGTGLGLSPLISGIARLFGGGGGGASEIPPVVKFALPGSLNVNAGVGSSGPGAFGVDYGQGGLPRAVVSPQQITVQVQAMDSRSFMDHSDEIAMAVRQAMLESGVLNDVVREA
jgi:hypothetical protein